MNLSWSRVWKRFLAGWHKNRESVVSVPRTLVLDQSLRTAEARRAVQRSRELLDKVESLETPVDEVTQSMSRLLEANGFAGLAFKAWGGGRR